MSGSNHDDYEYIYVPTRFTEDKWLRAAEVLPGDKRVVHHATGSVIAADKVATEEAEHSKPKCWARETLIKCSLSTASIDKVTPA